MREGDGSLVGIGEGVEIGADEFVKLIGAVDHQDFIDTHGSIRQCSCLIETKDVDAGEHFDGIEVLHKGVLPGQGDDRTGKGDGSEEVHAGRNHTDHTCGHGLDSICGDVPGRSSDRGVAVIQPLRPEGQSSERNDDDADDLDDGIEGTDEFRFRFADFLGLGLDTGDIVVFSDEVGLQGG